MKKKLIVLAAITAMLVFSGVKKSETAQVMYAEETSQTEVVSSEEEQEQEEEKNVIVEKINNFKDTFLVPLLSGVSATAVVGAAFSFLVSLKNRKTYNLLKQKSDEVLGRAVVVSQQLVQYVEDATKVLNNGIEQCNLLCAQVSSLISRFENSNQQIEELKTDVSKMLGVRECMLMLVKIQSEMAKINPKAVSEGIVKQIAMIEEQAEQMM